MEDKRLGEEARNKTTGSTENRKITALTTYKLSGPQVLSQDVKDSKFQDYGRRPSFGSNHNNVLTVTSDATAEGSQRKQM